MRATSLYSTNGWQQEAAVTHMQCSTELSARKRPSRATKSGCSDVASHQARATLARPEPAVKPACGAALQRCLALGMACVL